MGLAESASTQVHHVPGSSGRWQADSLRRDLPDGRHKVWRSRRPHQGSQGPHPAESLELSGPHLRAQRSWRNLRPDSLGHESRGLRLSRVGKNRRNANAGIYRPCDGKGSLLHSSLVAGPGRHLLDFTPPPGGSGSRGERKKEWEFAMKIKFTFWKAVFVVIMALG